MFSPNELYFDIETVPGCDWYMEEVAAKVTAPANYTKPESIKEWMATAGQKKMEDAKHSTGLIPIYGKIICIGFALNDAHPQTITGDNEKELLQAFFAHLKFQVLGMDNTKVKWIGHNICGFDIPYLWTRCMVNEVDSLFLPRRDNKPWETSKVFDTLYQVAGKDFKGHSLGNMAKLFGIKDKYPDVDGSMIWDMYREGLLDSISEYCINDVEITRQLYKRINPYVLEVSQ
jgi:predicted PolB exonuclease-like 3'-5' exonuclease